MEGENNVIEILERIERSMLANKSTLTVANLVAYTGYSKDTIHHLTSQRLIPHYKRENRLFFNREEIDQWLTANRVKTKAEIEEEAETYCAIGRSNARSIKRA